MKKLIAILLLLNLNNTSAADSAALCDKALSSCDAEILKLKDIITASDHYNDIMKGQRDAAYKDLEKASSPSLLPWWGWVIIGAAAFEVSRSLIVH